MAGSTNVKHSVTINGHSTSVTLEADFWDSLKEIAAVQGKSVSTLIAEIDRGQPGNLSGAIRVFVLGYYKGRK